MRRAYRCPRYQRMSRVALGRPCYVGNPGITFCEVSTEKLGPINDERLVPWTMINDGPKWGSLMSRTSTKAIFSISSARVCGPDDEARRGGPPSLDFQEKRFA